MGTVCGGACVDTAIDPQHCGTCGTRCEGSTVCVRGRCELNCGGALSNCGGTCVDPRSNSTHCGGCGMACPGGQRCVSGGCLASCPAGQSACAGACVDVNTDNSHCGACGNRCRTGERCAAGACRLESANISVRWEFPGLWVRGIGEAWLPTYLTHMFGSVPPITHPFDLNLACAVIENREGTATRVDLTVRVPGFGADANRSITLGPGRTERVCINPGWDVSRLASLRSFTNGNVEVYARLADGREISRAMRPFAAMASNGVVWDEIRNSIGQPIWWEDGGALSTAFVTPNDTTVLNLRRAAEARSIFPGGFGASPYERTPYSRSTTVPVGQHYFEAFALEPGEAIAWTLPSVVGGADADIDVYLFTEAQYVAWRSGAITNAVQVWRDRRNGAQGSYTASSADLYYLVLFNTTDNFVSRSVTWARNNTRFDIAYDALRSIFEELRSRGMTYVNIGSSYFEGVQLIRRPRESLEMRAANCIDGTFLFASVLENIGMEPWLVLLPGHAFVGVSTRSGSQFAWAIETTLVGSRTATPIEATFSTLRQIQQAGQAVTWVSVTRARQSGIRPLPL